MQGTIDDRATLDLQQAMTEATAMAQAAHDDFGLDPTNADAVESFIAQRLMAAGAWSSPRTSDGIVDDHVLESSSTRLRVRGRIYEIDQSLHQFWLELHRGEHGTRVEWTLYFDVAPTSSPRSGRHAIEIHDRAEDLDWVVILRGEAQIREGSLIVTSERSE